MSPVSSDHNLLLGLLALQTGLVSRDQLVAGFSVWVLNKQEALDAILLEQGALDAATLALLEALTARHLERHDGDARQSLATVSSLAAARADLQQLADSDLNASLGRVSLTDPYATRDGMETAATGRRDPCDVEDRFPTAAAHAATILGGDTTDAGSKTGATATPGSGHGSASSRIQPTSVGPYDILEEIARGGMGVVYKARHSMLGRLAAVKLIRSGELADESEVRRFQAESAAAAQLVHPGIVPVYEVGLHSGQHYMALAYIDGQSLWQRVQAAPLAPQEAARLMQQAADAVQYAHQQGIIHRDLKPQNILVSADGQARVTDFGLAKRHQGDSSLTATGQLLGTPSYMPPEQAAGKHDQIGPQSDIYSLGATLFCLLTGRPPFQAATVMETLVQVLDHDPVPPRSLNPAIPKDLELICLKCLHKDPERRYASCEELSADLRRFLNGETVSVRQPGLVEHLRDTIRKNRDDVELAAWAYLLSILAWIVPLTEFTIWLILSRRVPQGHLVALTIRAIESIAFGYVLWRSREAWWPPRTVAARQMLSQWLAFIVACNLCVVVRAASGEVPFHEYVGAYSYFAIFSGILWFSLGTNYWGYCYVFGCVFFAASVVFPFIGTLAPLVFGILWAGCLWGTALRLRRLAQPE